MSSLSLLPTETLTRIFMYVELPQWFALSRMDKRCQQVITLLLEKNTEMIRLTVQDPNNYLKNYITTKLTNIPPKTYFDYTAFYREVAEKTLSLHGKSPLRALSAEEIHVVSSEIQKNQNEALVRIWPILSNSIVLFNHDDQIAIVMPPEGEEDANMIRAWLNNNKNKLTVVKNLNLNGLGLKLVPPEIGLFTGLERLEISNNQIKVLPREFANLSKNLQILDISNNHLLILPHSLEYFKQLKTLDITNNPIRSFPRSIFGSFYPNSFEHTDECLSLIYAKCAQIIDGFKSSDLKVMASNHLDCLKKTINNNKSLLKLKIQKQIEKNYTQPKFTDEGWAMRMAFSDLRILQRALIDVAREEVNNHPQKDKIFEVAARLRKDPFVEMPYQREDHALDDPALFLGAFDIVLNGVVKL
jgi:hypothetical protein